MDNYPLVSIIIPVYNGSDYLGQAIDSAIGQTYKNTEIIVVNDGSTDAGQTHQLALSFGSKINYYHKENGGVASALNFGISKMNGDYFSWLSHDDLYFADKLEKQVQFITSQENMDCIIYSDIEIIDEKSKHLAYKKFKSVPPEQFSYFLLKDLFVNGCTLLIPKKCFEIAIFDEKLRTTQDNDLWLKLSKVYDFKHLPIYALKSRYHQNQGIRTIPGHQDEVLHFYQHNLGRFSREEWLQMSGKKKLSAFYFSLALSTLKNGLLNTSGYLFDLYLANTKIPCPLISVAQSIIRLILKGRRYIH